MNEETKKAIKELNDQIIENKLLIAKLQNEKLTSIPDRKERLKAWVATAKLENMQINDMGTDATAVATDIVLKLGGFRDWANQQIDKLP